MKREIEGHLMKLLWALRAFAIAMAAVCLVFGLLLSELTMLVTAALAVICTINVHRFMTGGTIIDIGAPFDGRPGAGILARLINLVLWWIPFLACVIGLSTGWLAAIKALVLSP
jgi:hypothetical protein